MKRTAIPLILVAVATFAACEPPAPTEGGETTEIPAVPVETEVLGTTTFVQTVEVSGVAEPIFEMRVAAEAPGRVIKAPFEEGKPVDKGDLLVRVDAQLDSARIDLLQNQLASAKREFERTKMLAREGLATPQQLDQASSSVDGAQLSLRQARVGIGKSTVRAPQAGLVATKYIEEGEYASPGAPIAYILDYSTIVIESAVPESDIGFVRTGMTVDVNVPSLDQSLAGTVERRSIVATPKTRTFPVEVHVPNGEGNILPGMRARVVIPKKTWEGVVVVPRDAILQGYEAKEAMVLPGSSNTGEAELRRVTLGPARGNKVVVTDGLNAGDRLIVKGHRSIVTGSRVKSVKEMGVGSTDEQSADETANVDEENRDDVGDDPDEPALAGTPDSNTPN